MNDGADIHNTMACKLAIAVRGSGRCGDETDVGDW